MPKVLLLNLPHKERITRRYMCSYNSPESLLPPVELISVGAIAREWKGAEVLLIDAIAEEWSHSEVINQIKSFNPDLIITLSGFECFEADMAEVKAVKSNFPDVKIVVFGHYPSHFKQETLTASQADFVIDGEPDLIFSDLYDSLYGDKNINEVEGIAYSSGGKILIQGSGNRIPDPNSLPIPAYDLLPRNKYFEPLMQRPFGMIQTARGCPYQCNYCVKSFGTKLTTQKPERILKEIKLWIELFNIRSLRFIDDTFMIDRNRIIELCRLITEENIDIEWACLSRADNIDSELLIWMKKAGCKRIYFGLESGSQRILDLYKKKINAEEALESLLLCRKHGIETAGFFMSGFPEETEDDFEKTINFAIKARLNYASFNPLTPYPGTSLFNQLRDQINFSLMPYKNEWKNASVYDDFARRKKIFYKKFYLRSSFVSTNYRQFIFNSPQFAQMGVGLLRYLWWDKKFVISGLKGAKDN